MIVNRKLDKFLRSLGETPKDVARSLLARKCRGVRGSYESCPISEAVRKKFRADRVVSDSGMVGLWSASLNAAVETPPAVRRFMTQFDDGKYGELCSGDL
jgi:hypothetical protein